MERRKGRPEEGSEHFWAYNAEYVTKKDFVHGELVVLGVLLMSALQQNDVDGARALAQKLQVRFRPQELGISHDQLLTSLVSAKEYARRENLAYSVIDARSITQEKAEELVKGLG